MATSCLINHDDDLISSLPHALSHNLLRKQALSGDGHCMGLAGLCHVPLFVVSAFPFGVVLWLPPPPPYKRHHCDTHQNRKPSRLTIALPGGRLRLPTMNQLLGLKRFAVAVSPFSVWSSVRFCSGLFKKKKKIGVGLAHLYQTFSTGTNPFTFSSNSAPPRNLPHTHRMSRSAPTCPRPSSTSADSS